MENKVNGVRDTLQQKENQFSFLLKLSDALRPLSNPVDIEAAATKIALDFMDADRCYYSTIEDDKVIILNDAVRGTLPSVIGIHSIDSFDLYKTVLNAGHPFVVEDVCTSDILDKDLKQLCLQYQYGSFINIPVIKEGKPVGLFSLVQCKPRKWTDLEVQLTIEAAERTWAAVVRAKAEEALRKSEEKYRMLFDSIDEGFSILEVLFDDSGKAVDYIFLEINHAHYAMTGLSQSAVGMRISEVMPDIEEIVLKRLGEIALTGKPVRYEQYVNALDSWFDVHSSRVGGEGSRLVANVFHNITERKLAEEKIKESESQFRALANDTPAFMFMGDAEANVEFVNRQWLEFVGLDSKEGIGKTWETITHPDDIAPMYTTYSKAVSSLEPYQFEIRQKRKDGLYRWVLWKGIPRIGNSGSFAGIMGVGFDIHEQKLAEEKLAYRTALLEAHNEASIDGILLVDAKGKIISFNQRFVEIWNMPQQIVKAKDDDAALSFAMTQLVNPQQFIDKVKYLYEHPTETSLDELEFKDGKIVERNGYPVVGEDGTYYAWSWTFRDITEQKHYEKTILESEERFRLLSNEMPQFVWTGDSEGNLGYFNDAVYKYSGLSKEDIVKNGWLQIVHPDDREENIRLWMHSISTGADFIFEHRFRRADGQYRWQLSRAIPQRNREGVIQQWIGTSTDIQDRKNIEEQLGNLVAERTKELQRSNDDLQQFAHVASHDLKEPVRKIKTFTSRLEQHLDGSLDETGIYYIERIHAATNRMFNMIDGVLTYSTTTNAITQKPELVDLNEVIKSIENDLDVALQKTGATLQYNDLPKLEGAPVLLYQLFYNMINNANKFVKAGVPPLIEVATETLIEDGRNFVRITVQDNGIGFATEQAEMIFETFTRLNSKDQYEGTGLGLSLCKKIVERHGGNIVATGIPDKGATFTIKLPLKQEKMNI